jgi:hypothetical protein
MGFISDALEQIKLKRYKSAATILEQNLNNQGLKPSARVELMEWTADCYSKEGEPEMASKWFESAARAALEARDIPQIERKPKAVKDVDRAIECLNAKNDLEEIKRLSKFKYSLAPGS